MAKNNNKPQNNVPLGLSMTFAQNPQAMSYFAALPAEEQQAVVDKAKSVKSKIEMQQYVSDLASKGQPH